MRILLVEDDQIMAMQLCQFLKPFGKVTHISSLQEAQQELNDSYFEIAFIDLDLHEESLAGFKVLELMKRRIKKPYLLTSRDDSEIIDRAFEKGVSGFFSKNSNFKQLLNEIESTLIEANWDLNEKKLFELFPTQSPSFKQKIESLIKKPSLFNLNLFISGESGVGKTYLVKSLCQTLFPRKKLFNLNLAEISPNLIESELFGHKAGSFTGAQQDRDGLFKEANGHILFLDEIASLNTETQVKLLKVLEEKRFKPVGSNAEVHSQFILITATCENILEKLNTGDLRKDFYYRINGHSLEVPTLENRKCDIPLIAEAWMKQSPRKMRLDSQKIEKLKQRKWRGNTRELIHFLKKAVYLNQWNFHEPLSTQKIDKSELEEVEKIGLGTYVSRLEKQIFNTYAQKYDHKVNKICRQLQLSKAVYYRLANS